MINSAAASVSGSLVLGLGAQAAPADDAAVSTDFAALLDNTLASGAATGQDGVIDPAAVLSEAIGRQVRQAGGNAAGKKLPQGLPDPAAALADAAKLAEGAAEDTATLDETATTLPAITTEIVLPGFVVPISPQLPQTPATAATAIKGASAGTAVPANMAAHPRIRQSTTDSLTQTAAEQVIRSPLPGAAESALAPQAEHASPPAQTAQAAAAQIPASPALHQTAASLPVSLTVPPVKADGTVAVPTASGEPAPSVAILAGSPRRADEIRMTIAPAEQPAPAVPSTNAQLASTQLVSAQAAGQVVSQMNGHPAMLARTTASKDQQPATAPAVDPAAAALAQAQATPSTPQAGAAAPRRETAPQGAAQFTADTTAARTEAVGAEVPAAPAQAPAPTLTQPQFGLHDGQSFSQATAPVASASPASGIGQTGHDFATLVDRLVEARDAASPASVHAAITHSEFGQVSLRFDQDANGLSVAMSSADPDFARAVQASSAQSQMSGDNGSDKNNDRGAGTPRQDTAGQQQTAGSASGQAQSQAQSSASGRGDRNSPPQTDTRTGRTAGQPAHDAEAADTRGGIYA